MDVVSEGGAAFVGDAAETRRFRISMTYTGALVAGEGGMAGERGGPVQRAGGRVANRRAVGVS